MGHFEEASIGLSVAPALPLQSRTTVRLIDINKKAPRPRRARGWRQCEPSLEIKVYGDSRPTVIPVVSVIVTIAVVTVMARVAPAVVTAGKPSVPPVPVALRAPMTMAPVVDLFDSAGLHLLGFWHEDRCGV